MKYRSGFAFVLLMASAALSSCKNPLYKPVDLKHVGVSIKSATAATCTDVCLSVTVELSVENKTDAPICLSVRYLTDTISKSLFLLSPDRKTIYDNFRVAYDPTDSAPDLPNGEKAHVKMLQAEPNIIVQPHSTLAYTASTGGKYKLPNTPMIAHMAIYLYPCDATQFAQYGYARLTTEAPLSFEPFTSVSPTASCSASDSDCRITGSRLLF